MDGINDDSYLSVYTHLSLREKIARRQKLRAEHLTMHRIGWAFLATFTCVAVLSPNVAGQSHGEPIKFSTCSASCGSGVMTGQSCDGNRCSMISEGCNPRPCDERKYRLSLEPWSPCSKECGGGTKTRSVGEDSETRLCNMFPCRLENGKLPNDDCPADVLIVIDRSGSMKGQKWTDVLEFTEAIIKGLPVSDSTGETRVGVITFHSVPDLTIPIGEYSSASDLVNKVKAIAAPDGGTNIVKAVELTYSTFKADSRFGDPNYRFAVIFITDGMVNELEEIKKAMLQMLLDVNEIATMSVGIGADEPLYAETVKTLASLDKYNILEPDSTKIGGLVKDMLTFICEDDCFRCDYSQGQMWLQYKPNCHQFYVCEPDGKGGYIKHLMTCGHLFWNQAQHTCTDVKTGLCFEKDPVAYTGPPIVDGPCTYKSDPSDPRFFFLIAAPSVVKFCKKGMQFSDEKCTCVGVGQVIPTCKDDLLLHYDFELDFVDITCHAAVADEYGDGSVKLVPGRGGHVASFEGHGHLEVPFLRTWFAENYVTGFSVALYYKRPSGFGPISGALVNNGDCEDEPGFYLRAVSSSQLESKIRTVLPNTVKSFTDSISATPDNKWYHVVWVYDGSSITVYFEKKVVSTTPVQGFLVNNDVPMYIGFDCDKYFFEGGQMDDLRVWSKALSYSQVMALP